MNTEPIFFVTGASGFIGSNLIGLLNQKGYTPYALLRKTSRLDLLEGARYLPVYGDVTGDDVFSQLPAEVGVIIHCAGAIKAVRQDGFIAANAQGTVNILQGARRHLPGLKRVVLISSQAAAGPCRPDELKCETEPRRPVSQYGVSKARMEEEVLARFSDMPLVIVRPPTVYGPGDRESLAFFNMVKSGFVPCVNRNRMMMSYLYIDDLTEALYRLATAADVPDRLYHLTSQDEVLLADFLRMIARQMGKGYLTLNIPGFLVSAAAGASLFISRLTRKPSILSPDKVNEMNELRWVLSGERYRALFRDIAPTPLEAGIARSLVWYRQKGWL